MKLSHGRKWIRSIAATLALLLILGATSAWYVGGKLLAPRQRKIGPPPVEFPCEKVSFHSESGAEIHGWFRKAGTGMNSSRGVVVLAHGIRGSRLDSIPRAQILAKLGYSTLLIDLQGHGESQAEQITLGWLEQHDLHAAVRFAKSVCPGERVAVIGFSLGGAAAVLGSPLEIDALVLEAVYPTLEQAIDNRTQHRLGLLGPAASWALLAQLEPRTGIVPRDLRPIDRVSQVECPVLVMGGGDDWHTTPEQTRQLYDAAAEPKQLVIWDGLGHGDFAQTQPERYEKIVGDFLQQHLQAEP